MIFVLLILVGTVSGIALFGFSISGPRYRGPLTDHFDGKKFINPGNAVAKGLPDVLKWMINRQRSPWKEVQSSMGEKPLPRNTEGIRITFVNHSTFLIQTEGLNILTDPIWSKRTSPFDWAGPMRMRPPGFRLEDLPKIDILLLSHNHWDHLDIVTVKKIYELHHPIIITPLGVKSFLDSKGVEGALDLDWWEERNVPGGLSVQAVPAQHFSGRGLFDRDATLWCGYVIKRNGGNIYFVGDTGYNPTTFKEIGARCAPIEIALVPIGAFKPAWFMSPIHCSPAEALLIHEDTGARTSIATHFGTFPLADDGQDEPILELQAALKAAGKEPETFRVPKEGVPLVFP